MFFARRTALLRIVALVGLAASAVLTADTMRPGRAFCPLETACNTARESALGEIAGIPTSVLGIGAFALLFALTLLPPRWARLGLRPAGVIAALAGQGFILYQAFVLETFCPFCVVADGAALLAALVILTWPPLPVYLSGKSLRGEPSRQRAAWVLACMAAAFLPFGWPQSAEPSWVEITPLPDEDVALESASVPAPPPVAALSPAEEAARGEKRGNLFVHTDDGALPTPSATALSIYPEPTPAVAAAARVRPRPTKPAPPTPAPAPKTHHFAPREPLRPAPRPPRPQPTHAEPEVRIVEYLNAYCAHCRATHRRLDQVLHATKANVKLRRVYTWASNDYPLWARACAYAATVGREDRMFEELLKTRSASSAEVYAAAKRAGLDLGELRKVVRNVRPPERLVRDKKLHRKAGLRGLPTLDIGRRRLMGEQSEAELSAAIRAALSADSS